MTKRSEVPAAQTWDLGLIYRSPEEAWREAEELIRLADKAEQDYKGNLKDAASIVDCLHLFERMSELAFRFSAYFELDRETDYTNNESVSNANKAESLVTDFLTKTSFIESEILEADENVLQEAVRSGGTVSNYLRKTLRKKPHTLQPETEKVLAALGEFMSAPYQVYNQAKLSDMRFAKFSVDGNEYPLGYALFEDEYEYEKDTAIRRAAFRNFSDKIKEYENVTAAAYNAYVCRDKRIADVRGYKDVFEYLLFEEEVTRDLYDRQIDVIMEKLAPHMRKYANLIKKDYGLDKMTYADLKQVICDQLKALATGETDPQAAAEAIEAASQAQAR